MKIFFVAIAVFAFFIFTLGIGLIVRGRSIKTGCGQESTHGHKCQCHPENSTPSKDHDCCGGDCH